MTIRTEIDLFGDLGNDGYYSNKEIIAYQAMTGTIVAKNSVASTDSMILDSGASDHMFDSRDNFVN